MSRIATLILASFCLLLADGALAKAKRKKRIRLKPLAPKVLLYDATAPGTRPRVLTFGRLPDTVSDAPILLQTEDGKPDPKPAMTDPE